MVVVHLYRTIHSDKYICGRPYLKYCGDWIDQICVGHGERICRDCINKSTESEKIHIFKYFRKYLKDMEDEIKSLKANYKSIVSFLKNKIIE